MSSRAPLACAWLPPTRQILWLTGYIRWLEPNFTAHTISALPPMLCDLFRKRLRRPPRPPVLPGTIMTPSRRIRCWPALPPSIAARTHPDPPCAAPDGPQDAAAFGVRSRLALAAQLGGARQGYASCTFGSRLSGTSFFLLLLLLAPDARVHGRSYGGHLRSCRTFLCMLFHLLRQSSSPRRRDVGTILASTGCLQSMLSFQRSVPPLCWPPVRPLTGIVLFGTVRPFPRLPVLAR